ncbi:methionine ABC transporter permease [Jiangella endophytica]|uniref:methionine ABC transporter permease n=1 Tax=Jiangella endophytica TaxID=1623398 RepID=UPI000E3424E0|nr:methionine ABC transporter permease [Jiangella endophytica]
MSWLTELTSNPAITDRLPEAAVETLLMVGWSALLAALGGLPLGLWLRSSDPGGLRPHRAVNAVLSLVVNVGRSLPFIILAIALIPVTRWLTGSALGWQAAVVPLTVGAIPFYARLAEAAVREVPAGKVEAALLAGASRRQVLAGVLVRESLPGLVSGFTVTVVALVSYSAMAGAIGAGGLGFLAISYGYNRFQWDVMIVCVVLIVLLVQLLQTVGDLVARALDHR